MTILQDGRERALECDECPETTDPFDRDDFQRMIATAKADGWKIELVNGQWSHICPDCKATSRLDAARAKFGL